MDSGRRGQQRIPRTGTMVGCCGNVRRRRAGDDLGTNSYDLRERLEVSRPPRRDRKIWKAGITLVELLEPLARSQSFIPPPLRLM